MTAKISEMPVNERVICENYRLAAKEWVRLDHIARDLEEQKPCELEARKCALIDAATVEDKMTDAKAERLVKASDEWRSYVRAVTQAKTDAAMARERMNHINKLQWAITNADANNRRELNMGGT